MGDCRMLRRSEFCHNRLLALIYKDQFKGIVTASVVNMLKISPEQIVAILARYRFESLILCLIH